jgi:hypothetical protein
MECLCVSSIKAMLLVEAVQRREEWIVSCHNASRVTTDGRRDQWCQSGALSCLSK